MAFTVNKQRGRKCSLEATFWNCTIICCSFVLLLFSKICFKTYCHTTSGNVLEAQMTNQTKIPWFLIVAFMETEDVKTQQKLRKLISNCSALQCVVHFLSGGHALASLLFVVKISPCRQTTYKPFLKLLFWFKILQAAGGQITHRNLTLIGFLDGRDPSSLFSASSCSLLPVGRLE